MITRRHLQLFSSLVILLFVLAACGGETTSSTGSSSGDSDNPTAVPPTDEPTAETPPEDTPAQQAPPATSAVSYSVTGDSEVAGDYDDGAWIPPALIDGAYEIILHNGSQEFAVILSGIPEDITPGTYTFATEPDTGGISAQFTRDLLDTLTFLSDVSGTLTISDVSDTISGSFEFTASTDPGAGGEIRTVTVMGTFNAVALPS